MCTSNEKPTRSWFKREISMPLNSMYERIDDDLQDDHVGVIRADDTSKVGTKQATASQPRAHNRYKKQFRFGH
jgi:hypothetical protein